MDFMQTSADGTFKVTQVRNKYGLAAQLVTTFLYQSPGFNVLKDGHLSTLEIYFCPGQLCSDANESLRQLLMAQVQKVPYGIL